MSLSRYVVTWKSKEYGVGMAARAFEHFEDAAAFARAVAADALLGEAMIGRQMWRVFARKWVYDGWMWSFDQGYDNIKDKLSGESKFDTLDEHRPHLRNDPRAGYEESAGPGELPESALQRICKSLDESAE